MYMNLLLLTYITKLMGSTFEDIDVSTTEFSSVVKNMVVSDEPPKFPSISMILISLVVLLFSLGYYFIMETKKENGLIAKLNVLGKELFILKVEKDCLENQLSEQSTLHQRCESKLAEKTSEYKKLEDEMTRIKSKMKEQEMTISSLKTTNETMLEEMSRARESSVKNKIDDMKGILVENLKMMEKLQEESEDKSKEIDNILLELKKIVLNKQNCEALQTKLDERCSEFNNQITSLQQTIDEKSSEITNLESESAQYKKRCENLLVKNILLDKALKEAHDLNNSSESLAKWLQVTDVRTSLESAQQQISELQTQLDQQLSDNLNLHDKLTKAQMNISILTKKHEFEEKAKSKALSKLKVMSSYFNEKENQLQKELSVKESEIQRMSQERMAWEEVSLLEVELNKLRSLNQQYKVEMTNQKVNFTTKLVALERQNSENWLSIKKLERQLKQEQDLTSALRTRLTSLTVTRDKLPTDYNTILQSQESLPLVNEHWPFQYTSTPAGKGSKPKNVMLSNSLPSIHMRSESTPTMKSHQGGKHLKKQNASYGGGTNFTDLVTESAKFKFNRYHNIVDFDFSSCIPPIPPHFVPPPPLPTSELPYPHYFSDVCTSKGMNRSFRF